MGYARFDHHNCLGLILAGGRSRRMGQDKALMPFGKATLFEYVLGRFKRQINDIGISTSSEHPLFTNCGHVLIGDLAPFVGLGPLSGLYAAFDYCQKAQKHPPYEGIITIAVDTPFFPDDYVARLERLPEKCCLSPEKLQTFRIRRKAESRFSALIGATEHRLHPTFAFWPLDLVDALQQHLSMGERSILSFVAKIKAETVIYPCPNEQDPFFNINTPQDMEQAIRRAYGKRPGHIFS